MDFRYEKENAKKMAIEKMAKHIDLSNVIENKKKVLEQIKTKDYRLKHNIIF